MLIRGIECGVYKYTLYNSSVNLKLLKQKSFLKNHKILGDEIWKTTELNTDGGDHD